MLHTLAGPLSSRCVRGILTILCAATVLLGLPGFSHALDAKSEARATIRQLKDEISTLENKIFAADLGIAVAKVAIAEEEKKPQPNQGALLTLRISLAVLEGKKNDLIKEKQATQRLLAEWEEYLRQLGG